MAYGRDKFDAPGKEASQRNDGAYDAFMKEAYRKAIKAVGNRVCGGTSGTGHVPTLAECGTGATGGVQITNVVSGVINGRLGTVTAQADLELPAGTQASATYVKYLISSGFGSSGTVTAGNEGTDSTNAHLPDLPDEHLPLGYVEFITTSTTGFVRTNNVLSGESGTHGTVNEFVDLVCMPYADEP